MKVPFIACNVKLDVYTTTNKVVLPHELELMSVRYGNDAITNIKPTGQFREVTDFAREYAKLRSQYGRAGEADNNRHWVEMAFGHENRGEIERSLEKGTKHFGKSAQGKAGAAKAKANKAAKIAADANAGSVMGAQPEAA